MKTNIVALNETNYHTWKIQCKMALMKDGLWNIVNGIDEIPEANDAKQKYIVERDCALAIIVLSIRPSLLYLIGDPQDPAVVWRKLSEQFQKKTWANKLALRRKLYGLKLKSDKSVQEHVKEMTDIFEELSVIGDPIEEEDRVVHLLASLPPSYDMLVTALEACADVPKLELVTERLLNEERKMKEKNSRGNVNGDSDSTSDRFSGASNDKAFAGKQYGNSRYSQSRCYHCGKAGHFRRNCDELKRKEGIDVSRRTRFKENANILEKTKSRNNIGSSDSDAGIGFVVVSHALSSESDCGRKWIIDSGATCHMCNDESMFEDLKCAEDAQEIQVGDGYKVKACGKGNIRLKVEVSEGMNKNCMLYGVLYVPDLSYNLVSVAKAVKAGMLVLFEGNKCKVVNNKSIVIATATKIGNLFYLNIIDEEAHENAQIVMKHVETNEEKLWHSRFGHLGMDNMKKLVKNELVNGLKYNISNSEGFCEPCVDGKHHRQKFPKTGGQRAQDILDLVHTDVCGKLETKYLSGGEYFLTFIDDNSRHTWCYMLKRKSEVFQKFMEWKSMVERATGRKLKTIRSDNGGEYTSQEFTNYLKDEGIHHEFTVPKTPEQNGVAERMNRTLQECVRTMLSESNLPKHFWAEALNTANYIKNRSPTNALINKTPYEAWNGKKPNVDHLKVFGCTAYAHVPKDERKKLDSKAKKCIFLGYGSNVKGYRLYDVKSRKVIISRDVIFNENEFHGKVLESVYYVYYVYYVI